MKHQKERVPAGARSAFLTSVQGPHPIQHHSLSEGAEPIERTVTSKVTVWPAKGWFAYLRLYGPEKSYFDKTWIPGDVELAN